MQAVPAEPSTEFYCRSTEHLPTLFVGELAVKCPLQQARQRIHDHARGDSSPSMTPHPIGKDEQTSLRSDKTGILVLLTYLASVGGHSGANRRPLRTSHHPLRRNRRERRERLPGLRSSSARTPS